MLPVSQEDFYFFRRVSLALVDNLQDQGRASATTESEREQDKANELSSAKILRNRRSRSPALFSKKL